MIDFSNPVATLREASAYISALRERRFVIHIAAEHLMGEVGLNTIRDVVRLHHFGARIILVLGVRSSIDALCGQKSLAGGQRVSNHDIIEFASKAENQAMQRVESLMSIGLGEGRCSVVNGNWISARPLGVINGVDHLRTGTTRSIDKSAIIALTESENIVQLGPIHYSMSGERYNLRTDELAMEVAVAVGAEKLIYLHSEQAAKHATALSPANAESIADSGADNAHLLRFAAQAIRRGVSRVHLLGAAADGALLQELLSRDGVGQLISADRYEGLRPASLEDVVGILALIEPLNLSGNLVMRSRQDVELDINHFYVIERDGLIIACAALLPITDSAFEVACLAVHPSYRGQGRASAILEHILATCPATAEIFALSTQTSDWFSEHGFVECDPHTLPIERLAKYDPKRASKVLKFQPH